MKPSSSRPAVLHSILPTECPGRFRVRLLDEDGSRSGLEVDRSQLVSFDSLAQVVRERTGGFYHLTPGDWRTTHRLSEAQVTFGLHAEAPKPHPDPRTQSRPPAAPSRNSPSKKASAMPAKKFRLRRIKPDPASLHGGHVLVEFSDDSGAKQEVGLPTPAIQNLLRFVALASRWLGGRVLIPDFADLPGAPASWFGAKLPDEFRAPPVSFSRPTPKRSPKPAATKPAPAPRVNQCFVSACLEQRRQRLLAATPLGQATLAAEATAPHAASMSREPAPILDAQAYQADLERRVREERRKQLLGQSLLGREILATGVRPLH